VGGIARIDGAEGVFAGGESKDKGCLALSVERRAGQLAAVVAEGDGTGCGKPILAADGDGDGSGCASALVAEVRGQRGLRGQALLILRGKRQRGHG
jgi:hypothetical protein